MIGLVLVSTSSVEVARRMLKLRGYPPTLAEALVEVDLSTLNVREVPLLPALL